MQGNTVVRTRVRLPPRTTRTVGLGQVSLITRRALLQQAVVFDARVSILNHIVFHLKRAILVAKIRILKIEHMHQKARQQG